MVPPEPCAESDNIPWSDPAFSRRMLAEHLSQAHGAASRRFSTIDAHVEWIHSTLLTERPSSVLDLGCGPGLYLDRLARKGHAVTGIDYSPASIAHARETAHRDGLTLNLIEADLREADFGSGLDLVMFISGELNVFRPEHARDILSRANGALGDGGRPLLEVSSYEALQRRGSARARWYAAESGLWSDQPHIVLEESWWAEASETSTVRYFIIDEASGEVSRYAATYQAYTEEKLRTVLRNAGFGGVTTYESMGQGTGDSDFFVIVAARSA